MPDRTPKVFVSHASEDKARFVEDFARNLRQRGIDAWYDKWEMLPGDSLVDKVFEAGIKDATAIIVVLSQISVTKPWVKEELNAAVIARINGKSKLIPVIIEKCEIPVALQSTLYQRIENLSSYDTELNRIVNAILGATDKPALGNPPAYLTAAYPSISGLNKADVHLLKILGDQSLSLDLNHPTNMMDLKQRVYESGFTEETITESLLILEKNHLVDNQPLFGQRIGLIKLTLPGFETYLQSFCSEYPDLIRSVALQIVNDNKTRSDEIGRILEHPQIIILHVFELFKRNGLLSSFGVFDGTINETIYEVSPALKRWLEESL